MKEIGPLIRISSVSSLELNFFMMIGILIMVTVFVETVLVAWYVGISTGMAVVLMILSLDYWKKENSIFSWVRW